jgi:hypothetical protein
MGIVPVYWSSKRAVEIIVHNVYVHGGDDRPLRNSQKVLGTKLLVCIKFVTFYSMGITEYVEDNQCWRYTTEKGRAFLAFCIYAHVRDQETILKWWEWLIRKLAWGCQSGLVVQYLVQYALLQSVNKQVQLPCVHIFVSLQPPPCFRTDSENKYFLELELSHITQNFIIVTNWFVSLIL